MGLSHNKKKKFYHESADQNKTSNTVHISETINNIKKSDESKINKIINYISSKSSYKIEIVALQSVNVDISQN